MYDTAATAAIEESEVLLMMMFFQLFNTNTGLLQKSLLIFFTADRSFVIIFTYLCLIDLSLEFDL